MSTGLDQASLSSPEKGIRKEAWATKAADKSHQSLRNGTLANKNLNSFANHGKPLTDQRPSIGPNKTVAINSADHQRKAQIHADGKQNQLYFVGNSQLG